MSKQSKEKIAAADTSAARAGARVDRQLIRDLAALLAETGLSEIEWSESGVQVRVARHLGPAVAAPVALATAKPPAAPSPGGAPAAASEADLANAPGAVKSPMVGTVYVAPEAGAAPFVKIGDNVTEGQTVLIIEAMKTMNPILAPSAGRVSRILAKNQQPVEFGQLLMLIE